MPEEEDQQLPLHFIHRLIPELLANIFLQGHYSSPNYIHGSIRRYGMPLIFTQVCKHWRAIALSTPELWSSLGYTLSPVTGPHGEMQAAMVTQWLDRAKSRPLSLWLRCSSSFVSSTHPVLTACISFCHQWQHVDLSLPMAARPTLNSTRGSLPMLRAVTFQCKDGNNSQGPYHRISAFDNAPLVYSLELDSRIQTHCVDIPWSQLTQCMMYIGGEYFGVLGAMSNIVKLTLTIDQYTTFHARITFPLLRTFRAICKQVHDTTGLWDCLTAPSLYDLTIERNLEYATSWGPQIIPYVCRWKSTIRRLTFCNAHLSHEELIACIDAIPFIEKLEIEEQEHSDYVSNEFVRLLQIQDGEPIIAPKLKYIGFKGFYYHFEDQFFVDMVRSRWHVKDSRVSRLKAVMLRPERTLDKRAFKDLMELKAEGLGVYIFGR